MLRAKQYSFEKLTQFSKGKYVQHTPASNKDCIVRKDTSVSPIHLNRAIFHKMNVSPS
jgi:hypothetical protein